MGGVVSLAASLTPILLGQTKRLAGAQFATESTQCRGGALPYRRGAPGRTQDHEPSHPGGDGRRLQNLEKPALECLYIVIQAGGASASLGSG